MTTKECLHKLVDELSEQEADETLQLVIARRKGKIVDGWGDLDEFSAHASSATLRRLDEQEAAAGFSWDDQPQP